MFVEEDTFSDKLDWSLWRRMLKHAVPYKRLLGLSSLPYAMPALR
jgi:hypothetical protein